MVVETEPKATLRGETVVEEPKFRDPAMMTYEQLHDPDYHIKQLAKHFGGDRFAITCSKCHHCR